MFPDYQGHFFVDATGAGGGELHVSVMGLKGIRFLYIPIYVTQFTKTIPLVQMTSKP